MSVQDMDSPLLGPPKLNFWAMLPFLCVEASVGLCLSMQATFYPIEARDMGATSKQFGAVFGTVYLSLFIFGEL